MRAGINRLMPCNRALGRLALIAWLGATGGCSSRVASAPGPTPPAVLVPPQAEPVIMPPAVPERTTPPPPAATGISPENSPADCSLISAPTGQASPQVSAVALGEPVNPANAPHPKNESERLLFRQVYETLIRVDCEGHAEPSLAASWKLNASGTAWIVTLRPNARFSDGTPVAADDVVSAWTVGRNGEAAGGGIREEFRPEVRRLIESVAVVDDRTLEIVLQTQRADAPLALAHTDLAIARNVPGLQWPIGTRAAGIATSGGATPGSPSVINLIRLPLELAPPNTPDSSSSVRFLVAPGRDARDLLDEGVDLLLTRDATALAYAAALPQFVVLPLPWQHTHVLLTPGRSRTSHTLSPEDREILAHDAVRGEARGALGPFWWESVAYCGVAYSPSKTPAAPTARIIYDGNDAVARDLAERLVGLVGTSGPGAAAILDALLPDRPGRTFQRAAGLTGEALASALRGGNDAAYIVAVDRRPLDPCREMQAVVDRAGWLDPETIVPLVDTRLQAIVRRGRASPTAEWDGGLLLADGERRAR